MKTIFIPPDLHAELKSRAALERKSLSDLVAEVLSEYVKPVKRVATNRKPS